MTTVYLVPYLFSATVVISYNKGYQFYSAIKLIVTRFRVYGSFIVPGFYKACDIIIHHVVTSYPVNMVVYLDICFSVITSISNVCIWNVEIFCS